MSSIHAIPELNRKGLREFGLTTGGIVAVLFGLFFPWLLERPIPRWPWVLVLVLGGLALVAPMALNPIYKGWMKFGQIMSRIMTPLIMGLVFFVAVTPMAWLMKLRGKDGMARNLDRTVGSYRIKSEANPPQRLEKPF